ncbi:Ig-like domain-containing protein, partial [Gemmiger formicilis]|uniref:GH25 family lysozyme n=1 Tax=Gemmiger formicilis TaxID=745368 RepID=UPI00195DCFA2
LALCLLCLLVVVGVCLVLTRCSSGPTGPEQANFGTTAAAWQKNELGYYFNSSGQAMPAAVLKGIDVSKFQGEVDWEKAKAAGIDFAIIRCGYGGEWDGQEANWAQDDDQWRRNADECTRLGIPFGVYLYSYATTVEEARSEADHVARLLGLVAPPQEGLEDYTASPYQLSYPVYYDLEDKSISGIFPEEMAAITQAFFDRLVELGYTGEQGIYASLNWVRARFSDPAFDPWRENLWIARFSDSLGYTGTYDMWQCTYSAPGTDYGVQSETVDVDFVMRPFAFTGITEDLGKAADPVLVNDTYQVELHLDAKDARATLTTNQASEEEGGQKVYWETSDKNVATVDKNGTVRARTDSGECTITATLADGTESISCLVRIGDITVPVFATGQLAGQRSNDEVSLADVAALKGAAADSILLDAGGSLHGTMSASLTGGMDMLSSFSAAGYDLQAFGAADLAYGIERLRSDANMASGPSLAANLRDAEGSAIFYRSTSWNRNRITNGMNYVVERAGYKIGFFSLADTVSVTEKIGLVNEETPIANDLAQTASEQVAALQAEGVDAILCIATPGVDVSALQDTLAQLGVTAVIDGGATENQTGSVPVLAAGQGLNAVGRLNLVFTQGGNCRVELTDAVSAETLKANRDIWNRYGSGDTGDASSEAAADAANPEKDTAADSADPSTPTEGSQDAQQEGADAYFAAAEALAELDADDSSILNTPLFTYAQNPDADKTISYANYLATLYEEIAENDREHWPEGWAEAEVTGVAGGVTELEYGDITRQALIDSLPTTARLVLVSTTAEAAQALIDGGTVTRTYQASLTGYEPEGENVLLVGDTQTLTALGEGNYTILRDYGDLFWDVRMNINDNTNNFTENFVLPEAPSYGVGRNP